MRILALERDLPEGAAAVDVERELSRAEAGRVWELYQAGIVREMYFRTDRSLAVLVLECVSVADAADAIASLPLVQAGAIDFELVPLRAYSGFARLFADTDQG